jgi:hypothetical protein
MGRQAKLGLAVLLAAGIIGAFATTAAAQTSGSETFDGTIVASASASGDRTVQASVIRARGAFDGVGRIVEVPNGPGDPDNILRDDLVFAAGSMHIVTTVVDVSMSVDPRSCVAVATVQQTAEIQGGTGAFAAASGSFVGMLRARIVLARNPDRSCSDSSTVIEIDTISAHGTLAF